MNIQKTIEWSCFPWYSGFVVRVFASRHDMPDHRGDDSDNDEEVPPKYTDTVVETDDESED